MDVKRIGISQKVRNELAILPAVPNVVIIENAIGPHEQAPADAPIIVPITLELIFLVSLISFTRKMFIDTAMAERIDSITINEKLGMASEQIWKIKKGSRKRNSEMVINGKNSKRNTPTAIKI